MDYLISGISLLALDSVYLSLIKNYFNKQIKKIQGEDIQLNMTATIATYMFLSFALYYFIIKKKASVTDAFYLGLSIYAVYELTSKAIFKNWSYMTVIIDTLWGGILFASSTYITKIATKLIKKL
uniref:DUF2177 family protein n=1 Tax=viral metagenome TaxID=1070528 RepID=A0A6C0KGK8_9ZZZZ